jgi:beta-1,4-N-acetylglucosaminyltransferase
MKLLIVLGGGGHTTEMLHLVQLLGPEYEYHYLLVREVALSPDAIKHKGEIHPVRRPRGRDDSLFATLMNSVMALFEIARVLVKVRPKAVVGCGPAIAVLASAVGKLLGCLIIFVETGSRVNKLSVSGKLMYRLADQFFVQWPHLQAKYPKAIYAGRL